MMIRRTTRLRMRRVVRRRRQQVEDISATADQTLDRHFVRRLTRLVPVRRFVIGWMSLLVLLILAVLLQTLSLGGKYQVKVAATGGVYTEGILGTFTNANPLYATGSVDSSVSRLLFASLLKYDENHQLVGDLAETWSHDSTEKIYTVKLRPGLTWHDGQPLTARDVAFTYHTIQNPDTRSHLQANWQAIKVEATDDSTVVFTLPSQLSAFPHSLTNGIVPEHILGSLSPSQLRSSDFNTVKAVGAGPFRYEAIEVKGDNALNREESVSLSAFDAYHDGVPSIKRFVIRTFKDENQLVQSFQDKQLNGVVGLAKFPDQLRGERDVQELSIPVMGQVMVFFKTSSGVLSDVAVRQALVLSADKKDVLAQIPYGLATSDGPLLRSHLSYDPKLQQVTGNSEQANKILDAAGWLRNPSTGIRAKASQELAFSLYAQDENEYKLVSSALEKQWKEIGVKVKIVLQNEEELKSTVSTHGYDALLDAISLGPDPDVYAYWHSSQADPRAAVRLNFSEYKSDVGDKALEGGRTRLDPAIRKVKYKPFLEAWQKDAPALALYQPRFLYVARQPLHGFDMRSLVVAADRYANVEHWKIREQNVKYSPDLQDRL